jgi:glyoxylase-like metal-dependent hydrolase (beta-lactamase superfamily II)
MKIHVLTYNPFQENTYLLECRDGLTAIVDPGMYDTNEREHFLRYLSEKNLKPAWLLNTHAHLDHIFGNAFCSETFNIGVHLHPSDLDMLHRGVLSASIYGLRLDESPEPEFFFSDNQRLNLAGEELEVRHTPGHSPGHVVLINHSLELVIGGDVLFQGSVGRTDLPGGDAAALDKSIRARLYSLPGTYRVWPGHGPSTTIAEEKSSNYFVYEGGSRLV